MYKMSKTFAIFGLLGFTIIFAPIVFYMTNLLASDLSNMFYGVHDYNFIASIPGFMFAVILTLGLFYIFRYYFKQSTDGRRLTLNYLMGVEVLSCIGFITSIMTATMVYHNLFAPYPFAGYTFLMMLAHLALMVGSIVLNVIIRKKAPVDANPTKLKPTYVLLTIVLAPIVYFMLYRTGSYIWSSVYIDPHDYLYLTSFYLVILTPAAFFVLFCLYKFGLFDKHKGLFLGLSIGFSVLAIGGHIALYIIGATDTYMLSVISMAFPVDRLGTKPYFAYAMAVRTAVMIGVILYYSISKFKKVEQK